MHHDTRDEQHEQHEQHEQQGWHEHHEYRGDDSRQADHTGHADQSAHAGHAAHAPGKAGWSMAARATLHCLTGCAIGEILGMVIGTALGWGNAETMVLAIILAFAFGYTLTLRSILKAGVDFRTAFRVALAADTLSIAVMELIDNGVIALWPGAMDAQLADALFWGALALSLAVAFAVTTPVNKWMIGRGKGHAVVHRYHH
ncbi:DUF4396 domain-containing protein [Streptomyces sp. NBC_00154]|uniref:DUF4396 domain-containing protein n=1 Tax=Streptomyces sp. NBC_00154 TaxID=2975670 RepID=UPI0022538E5D|nr:DUF4396 domain-containing protein [Streptomyces sp. NBC_00154]MCX5313605.1 DUF4396 domain-containing protein [Streptomyces sp. NBC_00154]